MRDRRTKFSRVVAALGLLVFTPALTRAQEPPPVPPGPLTLEQVLGLAEPRSESIQIAQAGVRRAQGDEVRARSGRYPQLSASAGYDRALASEFEGLFDVQAPNCPPFTLNPQATIDARVAEIERAIGCGAVGGGAFGGTGSEFSNLPFGRKNTWRAGLQFSQSLYSGGRLGAQAAVASIGHESANLTLTSARAQLLFEVTQAYYDAVLSEALVTIASATLDQAGATLKQTQAGFDAGTQPEFEVLRARVNRDNQSPVLIRQQTNRDVAMLRLKRLLNLPVDYPLQLADALGGDMLPPPTVYAERVGVVERMLRAGDQVPVSLQVTATLPDRTVVTAADATVRAREAALKLAAAQKMPNLSFNSSYGRVGYPSGVSPTFDRANWTVGASMTVPVLTGGRQRGDEAVAQAELDQARLDRQQTAELAALDTRSAWAELLSARATWEASSGTIEQAQRAYQIANVRFTNGVSTQLELSDSRLLLQQAEANRVQAARDLQVARAHVALLPDLPITAGGGQLSTAAATVRVVGQSQAPVSPPPPPPAGSQIRSASFVTSGSQAGIQ
ncbi:MAG TPA: TolC family protein [Vicinamibacterales bacterium]|jgi:outer membrane protein TolC